MLGGERFPVLIGGYTGNLNEATDGNLWYGTILENHSGIPIVKSMEDNINFPWAVQEYICEQTVKDLCGRGKLDSCWVPRSDFKPTTTQAGQVGGKAGWHPGYRVHKYNARKQSMLMMKALDRAFEMWEDGMNDKGFPLNEEYWHVGKVYDTARSKLSTYINGPGLGKSPCEEKWKKRFGLDRACRMSVKGLTEWTPINRGYHNSLRAHLKSAPNGFKPDFTEKNLYEGVDILPVFWKVPDGHIDVHAVAIASTYAAPELDQSWVDKDDADAEEADNSRRFLRRAATERIVISTKNDSDYAIVSDSTHETETQSRELSTGDNIVPGIGWLFNPMNSSPGYCDVSGTKINTGTFKFKYDNTYIHTSNILFVFRDRLFHGANAEITTIASYTATMITEPTLKVMV